MRTAAYKAGAAGTGMWQDTFFISCRKERTVSLQRKQLMKMDTMVSGGGRIGDVGKYIQKTKMKIMLFSNGFFRKKDINSTYD